LNPQRDPPLETHLPKGLMIIFVRVRKPGKRFRVPRYTGEALGGSMHTFTLMFYYNYSVFDKVGTSKCSLSGRLVHAVLWYYFQASIIRRLVDVRMCLVPYKVKKKGEVC
jgi:hypothetical protein